MNQSGITACKRCDKLEINRFLRVGICRTCYFEMQCGYSELKVFNQNVDIELEEYIEGRLVTDKLDVE